MANRSEWTLLSGTPRSTRAPSAASIRGSGPQMKYCKLRYRSGRCQIADQGWGIHPDDVPRLFEKFGRGRDREGHHERPGVGLGLYLSQRIVRGHGSELTVQTRPGEGSVFRFELRVER
jgi:signal transduction histidine kinase